MRNHIAVGSRKGGYHARLCLQIRAFDKETALQRMRLDVGRVRVVDRDGVIAQNRESMGVRHVTVVGEAVLGNATITITLEHADEEEDAAYAYGYGALVSVFLVTALFCVIFAVACTL